MTSRRTLAVFPPSPVRIDRPRPIRKHLNPLGGGQDLRRLPRQPLMVGISLLCRQWLLLHRLVLAAAEDGEQPRRRMAGAVEEVLPRGLHRLICHLHLVASSPHRLNVLLLLLVSRSLRRLTDSHHLAPLQVTTSLRQGPLNIRTAHRHHREVRHPSTGRASRREK